MSAYLSDDCAEPIPSGYDAATGFEDQCPAASFAGLGYDVFWLIAEYCPTVRDFVSMGATCTALKASVLDADEAVWGAAVRSRRLYTGGDATLASLQQLAAARTAAEFDAVYFECGGDDDDEDESEGKKKGAKTAADFVAGGRFVGWRAVAQRHLTERSFGFTTNIVQFVLRAGEAARREVAEGGADGAKRQRATAGGDEQQSSSSASLGTALEAFPRQASLANVRRFDASGGPCIGTADAWVIACALKHAASLEALGLAGMRIGSTGALLLALAASGGDATRFDAAVCGEGEAVSTKGKGINDKVQPTNLHCSYAAVKDAAAASSSSASRSFVDLCLGSGASPSDSDPSATCRPHSLPSWAASPAVGFGRTLTSLNLDECKLSGAADDVSMRPSAPFHSYLSGAAVAALLLQCPNLCSLSMRRNKLTTADAVAIAGAMVRISGASGGGGPLRHPHGPQLASLRVSCNPSIGDAGAAALIGAMAAIIRARTVFVLPASPLRSNETPFSVREKDTLVTLAVPLRRLRQTAFLLSLESCGLNGIPAESFGDLRSAAEALAKATVGGEAPFVGVAANKPSVTIGVGNAKGVRLGRNKAAKAELDSLAALCPADGLLRVTTDGIDVSAAAGAKKSSGAGCVSM